MGCDDCGSNSQKYSLSGDQEVSKSTNKTQASTLQFLVLLPPCTKSIQKYEKTWKNSPCVLAILHKGYNSGIQLSGGYSPGSLANNTFIDIYRWFSRVFLFRKWGVIVKMGSDCPFPAPRKCAKQEIPPPMESYHPVLGAAKALGIRLLLLILQLLSPSSLDMAGGDPPPSVR